MRVQFPIEGKYILCVYSSSAIGGRMILSSSENALAKVFSLALEKRDPSVKIESVLDIEIVSPKESFRKRVLAKYLEQDKIMSESNLMWLARDIYQKTKVTPKGFEWLDLNIDHELVIVNSAKEELLSRALQSPLFCPIRKGFEPRGRVVGGKGLKMVQSDQGPHRRGIVLSKAYPSSEIPLFYFLELGESKAKESLVELREQYQERARIRLQALKAKRDEERRLRELEMLPYNIELCKFFGIDPKALGTNDPDIVR